VRQGTTTLPTNLAIDDSLIDEARRIGGHRTKKDAVTAALQEYIRRRRQMGILRLAGKVDYDPKYDYKALRRRRRG
jgi:Arc/MetJ family transcription regulator